MRNKLYISLLIILISMSSFPYNALAETAESFKVMGYFCETPFTDTIDESVDFERLTHIIYGFLKPKADGSLYSIKKPELLQELIEKAHKNDVKVIVSIGGIYVDNQRLEHRFTDIAQSDELMANFILSLTEFMDQYAIDGIELDWEYPRTNTEKEYESFVVTLADFMHKQGKSFSAAVAGAGSIDTKAETVEAISDQALQAMDFINIMVYDLKTENQSPFWFADYSIQYYLNRGVPSEKIILGIPLYALPSWKQYRHLIEENKAYAYQDFVEGGPLNSSYNGLYTIGEKTRLSLNKGGGVMFFDIHEDTHDETSALKMVEAVKQNHMTDPEKPIIFADKQIICNSDIKLNDQGSLQIPIEEAILSIGAKVFYSKDYTDACVIFKDQYVLFDDLFVTDGNILINLREFYEALGYKVTYRSQSNTVVIN